MKGRSILAAFAVVALGTLASPASAQVTGTVTGSVKDAQGGMVPGATITLVSATRATKTETVTNAEGDYVFPNVTAGTHIVRVSLERFQNDAPGENHLRPCSHGHVDTPTLLACRHQQPVNA